MSCASGQEIKEVFFLIWILPLECEKQCSSISLNVLEITKEEHDDNIKYQPVRSVWQKEVCSSRVGGYNVRGNYSHWTQPSIVAVSHHPLATARIAADRNCFSSCNRVTGVS